MKTVKVPTFIQPLFGKQLSLLELGLTLMFGTGMTALFFILTISEWHDFVLWRLILLLVITVDITAGIVANLLYSVNSYYHTNSKARWFFIIIHFQPIILAWLFDNFYEVSFIVWAYTILSTLLVNRIDKHSSQRIVAVVLAISGVSLLLLLCKEIPIILLAVLSLYMFKLIFCFAVDHDMNT
jgi:hypothetical protein